MFTARLFMKGKKKLVHLFLTWIAYNYIYISWTLLISFTRSAPSSLLRMVWYIGFCLQMITKAELWNEHNHSLHLKQRFGSAFFCGSGYRQKSSCGSGSGGKGKIIFLLFFTFQMILKNFLKNFEKYVIVFIAHLLLY